MKSTPEELWPCLKLSPFLVRHAATNKCDSLLRSAWCRDMTDKTAELEITRSLTCSEEKNQMPSHFEPFFCLQCEDGVATVANCTDFRQR